MFYSKLKVTSVGTAACVAVAYALVGAGLFAPGFARDEEKKPKPPVVAAQVAESDPKSAPIEVRKVMSMATDKPNDFRHAVIAVSNEHKSMLSRNLIISDQDDPKAISSGLRLWTLDGDKSKRTTIEDSITVGFIPKSTLCFTADWGMAVEFYDTRTHAKVGRWYPHEFREDTMPHPAVSPDGEVLVTRSKLNQVQFWNLKTSKPIAPATAVRNVVSKMEFSADGKWLFSYEEFGELNVWDPTTGERAAGPFRHDWEAGAFGVVMYPVTVGVDAENFSLKTQQLATVENGSWKDAEWKSELIVRSSKSWGVVHRVKLAGHIREVKWIDDTRLLVVGDETPKLDAEGRRTSAGRDLLHVVTLNGEKNEIQTILRGAAFIAAAVAPDGMHFIASASVKGTSCWKVGEEKPIWTKPHGQSVHFGNGDWGLLTNKDEAIVYAVADGKELWRQDKIEVVKAQGSDIWVFTRKAVEVWRVGVKMQ